MLELELGVELSKIYRKLCVCPSNSHAKFEHIYGQNSILTLFRLCILKKMAMTACKHIIPTFLMVNLSWIIIKTIQMIKRDE